MDSKAGDRGEKERGDGGGRVQRVREKTSLGE